MKHRTRKIVVRRKKDNELIETIPIDDNDDDDTIRTRIDEARKRYPVAAYRVGFVGQLNE